MKLKKAVFEFQNATVTFIDRNVVVEIGGNLDVAENPWAASGRIDDGGILLREFKPRWTDAMELLIQAKTRGGIFKPKPNPKQKRLRRRSG